VSEHPSRFPRKRDPFSWLGRHEFATLVVIVLIAAGVWGFAELADEVMEGETASFDERVLLAMRHPADRADPRGPEWVEEIGRDLTALGGMATLTFLTLAVAGYLLLDGKRRAAVFVIAAIAGGMLLSLVLKESFDRPRPELVPYGSKIMTTSFPSGHSMMSAVTYLTLGALLARMHARPAMKAYVLILAVLLTTLVGVSRVYVGVHWPTDVLAGWTAGATWALLCWLAARWLQRRGEVEDGARASLQAG
jgi:undecaprenyl-diphosphatase